ncbi:hypothetical protein [Streptomyces sp. SID161]|nr:hypothetical protein [Streptomyces sp. SID161]
METGIPDHRAEPLLDLGRQVEKAREILLLGESDDHLSSLADGANVAYVA